MASAKQISKIIEIIKKSQRGLRKTTLNREAETYSPYQTLVSCLLSLRAKDETTEKISQALFRTARTPKAMLKIPRKRLEKIIFSSGHYRRKAEALRHVSQQLIERFNSRVPDTREELESIKHIGPKTANIVLAFSFGKQYIPVDIHVHIVSNRLGWIKTKTAEKSEVELMKVLPRKHWREINGVLVLFGKQICETRSPRCSICPVREYCPKIGVKKSR